MRKVEISSEEIAIMNKTMNDIAEMVFKFGSASEAQLLISLSETEKQRIAVQFLTLLQDFKRRKKERILSFMPHSC